MDPVTGQVTKSHLTQSHVARNFSYVTPKKRVKLPEETNTKKI